MRKCTNCGSDKLVATTIEETRRFGDDAIVGTIHGRRCEACGETFTPAAELIEFERKVADELVRLGNKHPKALEFIRKVNRSKAPNAKTVAAMREARKGGLPSFESVDGLMDDLSAKTRKKKT